MFHELLRYAAQAHFKNWMSLIKEHKEANRMAQRAQTQILVFGELNT